MSLNTRLRNIEKSILINRNGLDFSELLKSDFAYNGRPFNSIDEMFNGLNIKKIPSLLSHNNVITLLEKRIITFSSITAQETISEVSKEMREMM